MASKQEIAAVVDIGSTKICALAGEMATNDKITILGQASIASRGIKRGIVLNIDEFSGAVRELVTQLENQFGGRIRKIDVAMAGQGVTTRSFECVRYTGETCTVTQQDIDFLWNEAKNMPLEPGLRIYHIIPQNFTVDEETNIIVPIGHTGRKIVAVFKLITAPKSYHDNVEKALMKIGLQLGNFVISSIATAEAVINDDEKEAGVIVIDMGGGTTKMLVFADNKLIHTAVIPFGGEVITKDIKEGCSILMRWAEQLKIQYGQALGDFAEEEQVVTIPGYNGWEPKEISFKSLAFIMQARLEEIIDSIYFQIEKSGLLPQITQGIVITGGTSKVTNLLQLVKFRTGLDARIGFSQVKIKAETQIDKQNFITALGLLKLSLSGTHFTDGAANSEKYTEKIRERTIEKDRKERSKGFFGNIGDKLSQQITMMFVEEEDDSKM